MENRTNQTPQEPYITVVTGTLNRPKVVLELIKQLKQEAKKIPLEVIVVDQSTHDNYVQLLDRFPKASNFTLVHFDRANTCKYLNFGWKQAKAPVVLYLDDDVTITDKTIQAHLDAYMQPSIRAVAGRVINDNEHITTDPRVGKVLWFGAEFTKNYTYEHGTYVDFPYGCNMSFRRETLEEVGGVDEQLAPPIYAFNEVDLGYRISSKWKNSILFSPDALVYHHQYPRGGTRNDFEIAEMKRSNNYNYGYFLGKNFNWLQKFICFARRLPYQITKDWASTKDILAGFKAGTSQNK